MPAVLRQGEGIDEFDEIRLRVALKELTQLSLITHHRIDGNDSHSMHSLVHTWVRQRPQMSTAEQAIWSHAAATMLSQNILLPPLGLREADIKLRIDLMPHVDHVSKCRDQIKARILDNQRTRRKPWPVLVGIFRLGRLLALQYAKFSLVYSQCGRWHEAAKLQLTVKEYVCPRLGIEHPVAMRIVGALSGTYMQLSRTNEAAELQEKILQACVESLGSEHPKTLKVLDTLGSIRLFQGRFKDALRFGQEALDGMSRTLGTDNEDTLRAMENVGLVHTRYFRFQEERVLLEKVAEGMKRVLGPTHLDTLAAMESLAMTYLELSGDLLPSARVMMEEVLEQRKEKPGKEQPYTLLAICNLGRIRSVMGEHVAAGQMMRPALRIAERNLGENHFGTLAGKAHLARVIARAGRFQEAEAM
jgi:tetratricopeptide (TPR) repeat protein